MGLEVATYIADLNANNPDGEDDARTSVPHFQLIKDVLKSQFPALGANAVTATAVEINKIDGFTGSTADLNVIDGLAASGITISDFENLDGLTGVIQTQLDNIQTEVDGKAPESHFHIAGDINAGTFADARISQASVVQHQGALNHDSLLGYVAAEHISWGVTGAEDVHIDRIPQTQIQLTSLNGYVASEHVNHSSVTLTAGRFLSGGGTIASTRSFDLDFTGETLNSDSFADDDEFIVRLAGGSYVRKRWSVLESDLAVAANPAKTLTTINSAVNNITPANQIIYNTRSGASDINFNPSGVAVGTEVTIINSASSTATLAGITSGILGKTSMAANERVVVTRVNDTNASTYWHAA